MNSPWPIHSRQVLSPVETTRPTPIISPPNATVHFTPIRSAMRPMAMPPNAEPSQASEYASAGTDRALPSSPAICFSATTATNGAP